LIGRRLSHYEIIDQLGKGGMGEVYRATDTRLDRPVAIKVLPGHLADDPELRARFEREARMISKLNHPNICTLYDVGRDEGVSYLVMEYIDGETLSRRLAGGALSIEDSLRYGNQIGRALHEAHRAGVIHRDLKPDNIMLPRQGVKLLDFGLAKLSPHPQTDGAEDATTATAVTRDGAVIGTVPYMSPEQLEDRGLDARSDIFAFGAILFEMITGRRMFAGASQAAIISSIMTMEPPPPSRFQPDAPPRLDHLVLKCVAKDPDARWNSIQDLADQLDWMSKQETSRNIPAAPRTDKPGTGYRIAYFKSADGVSIASARGGSGEPLLIVPAMGATIEANWPTYAQTFPDRELFTYDRRGTGLSQFGTDTRKAENYLQDVEAVVAGFGLESFDVIGTLLGTIEAAWIAYRRPDSVARLVLRSPVNGMGEWVSLPPVRAALASLEHDWVYFTESFSQLVVGWGHPAGRDIARHIRESTDANELRALVDAYRSLNLDPRYPEIQAETLIEHHPEYFFPRSYSQRIASLVPNCRMAVFSGSRSEYLTDFSEARAFLATSS
jgi:serine/threonine protein kinase